MCYHLSQTEKNIDTYLNEFNCDDFEFEGEAMPFYYHLNGFARGEVMIITEQEPNLIQAATWSIAPPNHRNPSEYWKIVGGGALNTKIEALFDEQQTRKTPTWKKEAILENKCLILFTGMYKVFTGGFNEKTKKNNKHAILINRPKNQVFSALGYFTNQLKGDKYCSILTTGANSFFDFHNRMTFTVEPQDKDYTFNSLKTVSDFGSLIEEKNSIPDLNKFEVVHDVINSKVDSNNIKSIEPISSNLKI